MKVPFILVVTLLSTTPLYAQAPGDWTPWLGCWELTTENVRGAAPAAGRLADATAVPLAPADSRPRVCVAETAQGARFTTTLRGQDALEHVVVADGADHPLDDGECRGTERAELSPDAMRLYTQADVRCGAAGQPRRVSGLALLGADGRWVDVQTVATGGGEQVRVRRYRRVDDGSARVPASTGRALNLADVIAASARVAPLTIEAALVETNAGYTLSGAQLIELDDAGVPDRVIDLVVALSYPERFVVERTRAGGAVPMTVSDPFMLGWAFGYPVWYDDYWYSPYYYSPFGLSALRYGSFGSPYYSSPGVIVVGPGAAGPQPSGAGRVVDGLGYTRVRPREREASETAASSGGSRTRSTSGSDSSGGSSSDSSSGSGSAVSGQGYSSGGSSGGGETGRTAVPR